MRRASVAALDCLPSLAGLGLVLLLSVAACGESPTATPEPTPTPTATVAPTPVLDAAAGTLSAQNEVFGPDQEGDDRVIASIGDIDMTYGGIRSSIAVDKVTYSFSTEEAEVEAMTGILWKLALYEEAKARGLEATEKEVSDLIADQKALCEHPDNQTCADIIRRLRGLGRSVDEYYNDKATFEDFRVSMTIGNLISSVTIPSDVTSVEEQWDYLEQYGYGILAEATIVWKDPVFQKKYENRPLHTPKPTATP